MMSFEPTIDGKAHEIVKASSVSSFSDSLIAHSSVRSKRRTTMRWPFGEVNRELMQIQGKVL